MIPLPLFWIANDLRRFAEPLESMCSGCAATVDGRHPPVFCAVATCTAEQDVAAIWGPDWISGIRKRGLNGPGVAAPNRYDEDLSQSEGGACVLRSGEREERDAFSIRREL